MCNTQSITTPYWIQDYQPDNSLEHKLLINFRKLFANDINSENYRRAFSEIYNILIQKNPWILPDTQPTARNIQGNLDYGKVTEQNLLWLKRPLIVMTPQLIDFLTNYCQNHQATLDTKDIYHLIDELIEYLDKLQQEEQFNLVTKNDLSNYKDNLLKIRNTKTVFLKFSPKKLHQLINELIKYLNYLLQEGQFNSTTNNDLSDCLEKLSQIDVISKILLDLKPNAKKLYRLINQLNYHLNKLDEGEEFTSISRNYLSHYLEKLLQIYNSNTSDESDTNVLNQINPLIIRWRRIQFFNPYRLGEAVPPEGFYIQQGLATWIKINIRWRKKDLYLRHSKPPGATLQELDENKFYSQHTQPSNTHDIDLLCKYLKEDPHGYLASIAIDKEDKEHKENKENKDCPRCTYQVLAKHLINNISSGEALKFSHGVIDKISKDFQIPYQTLASQISRNFLPFVASLPLQLGFAPQAIKDAIDKDIISIYKDKKKSKYLKDVNKIVKHREVYNAQTLATKLLPMFRSSQEIADTIYSYLSTNNKYQDYNLSISINIDPDSPSYQIFHKISQELNYQLDSHRSQEPSKTSLTIYDIQKFWEEKIINQINQEIYNIHKITLLFKVTDDFWKTKCLKYLGKLVMILRENQQATND